MQSIQKMTDAELVEAVAHRFCNDLAGVEFLRGFITACMIQNQAPVRAVLLDALQGKYKTFNLETCLTAGRGKGNELGCRI